MTPLDDWKRCKPWIETALKLNGFYTFEYIEREVTESRMTFWPGKNAAALTEFIEYPNGRALNVFALAGEENASLGEFLAEFEPSFDAWAKGANCKWIVGYGRPGWQRKLKPSGYEPLWTVLAREVTYA